MEKIQKICYLNYVGKRIIEKYTTFFFLQCKYDNYLQCKFHMLEDTKTLGINKLLIFYGWDQENKCI